jgi:hypothetical protein
MEQATKISMLADAFVVDVNMSMLVADKAIIHIKAVPVDTTQSSMKKNYWNPGTMNTHLV